MSQSDGERVDTLQMPLFMKYLANEPYLWTGTEKERLKAYNKYYAERFRQDSLQGRPVPEDMLSGNVLGSFSTHLAVFKISLTDGKLILIRLDSLSDPLPSEYSLGPREAKGVYERSDSLVPWM
jgi:hypothetical protein